MKLQQILDEFDEVEKKYLVDPVKGLGTNAEKIALEDYNDKFTKLFKAIGEECSRVYGLRTSHDDKSSTAYRARLTRGVYDTMLKKSWGNAEKEATGSQDYEDFVQSRAFYYESWETLSHWRNSMKQYLINIGLRLKNL